MLAALNAAVLLGCASIYLGTGVSLVAFQFPGAERLTPDNYYDQFVPQVHAATHFFTWMTGLMFVNCALMIWSEWGTWYLLVPIVMVVLVGAATLLTTRYIFEYNAKMDAHLTDPVELRAVLRSWMRLNVVRVAIWVLEWLTATAWFVGEAA